MKSTISGVSDVRRRSIAGVKALSLRTIVSILLRVVSSLALAHLLYPRDYGLFGVAATIAGLGLYLADIGLGGALVRQPAEPSDDETVTVFCAQQFLTGIVVVVLIAASPILVKLYHLTPQAALLLKAMAVGLFLSSLRVVPTMALERELQFGKIARCEMIENVAQTACTVALAACGAGAWALAGGVLIRGAVGLGCMWAASPWRPRGRFRWSVVAELAKFGIPFQLACLAPSLIGNWLPLFVTRLLGIAALGFVNWAISLASIPQMLSEVLFRVAFPALSRLQGDTSLLLASVRSSLRRIGTSLSVVVPVGIILVPVVVGPIFGQRWAPAIPLVQWFCLEALFIALNQMVCAAQSAAGFAGDRFWVTVGIGLGRCGLGYAALTRTGMNGLGPSQAIMAAVELYVSLAVLQYRLPGEPLRAGEVFAPIVRMGAALALALGAGALAGHLPLLRAGVSLTVFIALVAVYTLMDKQQTLLSEVRGLLRMTGRAQPQQGS